MARRKALKKTGGKSRSRAGKVRTPSRACRIPRLEGRLGKLYHYRIHKPAAVRHPRRVLGEVRERLAAFAKGNPDMLEVDLGFKTSRDLSSLASVELAAGDIVRCVKTEHEWEYNIEKAEAGENDLYTYRASLEGVVDGETLIVHIDLGFGVRIRQSVALRGIKAPALGTAEGMNARHYLKRRFEKNEWFLLRSYASGKNDGYDADVWLPDPAREDAFLLLNQELLVQGIAAPARP